MRNAWTPTKRFPCPKTFGNVFECKIIPPKQAHSWFVEIQLALNLILFVCGQFWSKIRRQRTCRASHVHPQGALWHLPRLERTTLPKFRFRLGLRQSMRPHLHAQLYCRCPQAFPPLETKEAPRPTVPHDKPAYEAKKQYAADKVTSPLLDRNGGIDGHTRPQNY